MHNFWGKPRNILLLGENVMSSEEKQKNKNKIKKDKMRELQQEASLVRKIVAICFILITLAIIGTGLYAYSYIKSAISPMDESSTEVIRITIPIGSSSTRIGQILEDNGLTKNASFFRYYVRYKNESGFQAGDYELTKAMNIDEIISELKEGTIFETYQLSFTIPEGRWLEDFASVIAENTSHEEEDILIILNDEEFIGTLIEKYTVLTEDILNNQLHHPLEGYLFPARYDFVDENPSIEEIVEAMVKRNEQIYNKYYEDFSESDYSVHEILTLASIIEGEANKQEDRYKVSGVLYNRLNAGMPLQVDPTLAYAHGEHFSRTLNVHKDIDSPYNTYMYPGIPVGPINNPGEASIKAALQPEVHENFYFYATSEGNVIFTKTYAEHQEVLRKYRDN